MGDYNHVFEKLIKAAESELVALVAYGYYKKNKREWILSKIKADKKPPTAAQLKVYVSGISTDGQLELLLGEAESSLGEFYSNILDEELPEIQKEIESEGIMSILDTKLSELRNDLKPSLVSEIKTSIIGGFAYSVVLVMLYLIIRIFGIDLAVLATALQSVGG